MLHQFNTFIKEQQLFSPDDRILLTVSGGLDSMVMAELFHQAGYRFGIAHCNFQLRGEESDEDERFVEKLANSYEVSFYTTRFCTKDIAGIRKVSIQMAARELRYVWFEEICKQEGFDLIATAHHLDDQVETLFINLLRGTGIAGLHGIPIRNGKVIRPLLFASREEIFMYARKQNIDFREDRSNSSLNYTRNRIRHQLIPLLRSIDPDYARQITATIHRIQGTESILKPLVEKSRKNVLRKEQGKWIFEIGELKKLKPLQDWMYELLSPFEFNETTICNLIRSLDHESGKSFYSTSYRIIKDRGQLIMTALSQEDPANSPDEFIIDDMTEEIDKPIRLSFKSVVRLKNDQISTDINIATLDNGKLTYPLILRRWQPGDFFYPFGMNKRKKLSDFFIDEKIPIPDKEKTWLLCSGKKIVWVVGHRPDHRFRVTPKTKEVLEVRFQMKWKPGR